jgi:hypothetical protein
MNEMYEAIGLDGAPAKSRQNLVSNVRTEGFTVVDLDAMKSLSEKSTVTFCLVSFFSYCWPYVGFLSLWLLYGAEGGIRSDHLDNNLMARDFRRQVVQPQRPRSSTESSPVLLSPRESSPVLETFWRRARTCLVLGGRRAGVDRSVSDIPDRNGYPLRLVVHGAGGGCRE